MVNRQIRKEVTSIFYEENEFMLYIEDLQIFDERTFMLDIFDLKLEPQDDHWCWERVSLHFYFDENLIWKNFMDWLKKYCRRETKAAQIVTGKNAFNKEVIPEVFRLVSILKLDPWWKVEEALNAFRRGFNAGQRGSQGPFL